MLRRLYSTSLWRTRRERHASTDIKVTGRLSVGGTSYPETMRSTAEEVSVNGATGQEVQ